jgi:lysozyme
VIEIPQAAIELAKRFEGFHKVPKNDPQGCAYPYICPAGFWTIGYGHLCSEDHPPISEDEGEIYLTQDLQTALNATLRYCPVLATESEGRRGAAADVDTPAAGQPAGLGERSEGAAAVGLRWRANLAWADGTT